jgi:CheY-like chemotaxis protein
MKTWSETILLVEDDMMVRELNRDVLEKFGYRVIAAKDGEEALELYYANRDCISMLILDVVLPKKNGREVYEAILAENIGIRTLFMSGYAGDLVRGNGVFNGPVNFIPKPVSPMKLLQKVREVLDS